MLMTVISDMYCFNAEPLFDLSSYINSPNLRYIIRGFTSTSTVSLSVFFYLVMLSW